MKRGFTLIELLVVILIIGILSAIALPQYETALQKSRYATLMPVTRAVKDAEEAAYEERGSYTNQLDYLYAKLPEEINQEGGPNVQIVTGISEKYIKSSQDNLNMSYVMYLNNSENFPSEIHCEALKGDTRAKKVCLSFGANPEPIEATNPQYDAYVLEGSGSGTHGGGTEDNNGNGDDNGNGNGDGDGNGGDGGDGGDGGGDGNGGDGDGETGCDPDSRPSSLKKEGNWRYTCEVNCVNGAWQLDNCGDKQCTANCSDGQILDEGNCSCRDAGVCDTNPNSCECETYRNAHKCDVCWEEGGWSREELLCECVEGFAAARPWVCNGGDRPVNSCDGLTPEGDCCLCPAGQFVNAYGDGCCTGDNDPSWGCTETLCHFEYYSADECTYGVGQCAGSCTTQNFTCDQAHNGQCVRLSADGTMKECECSMGKPTHMGTNRICGQGYGDDFDSIANPIDGMFL